MENALEEFLMQEQPAVISSSQPLEAQQRACYKNDSYCESNEPLYIHTICLGRTSKFRKEALRFFVLWKILLIFLKKLLTNKKKVYKLTVSYEMVQLVQLIQYGIQYDKNNKEVQVCFESTLPVARQFMNRSWNK